MINSSVNVKKTFLHFQLSLLSPQSLNKNDHDYMLMEIHVLAWHRHKNVAVFNCLMGQYKYKQTIKKPAQILPLKKITQNCSDCCLMPTQQFYSASSLKQQYTDTRVAPLRHINLITSQPIFALSP